jgi:hypothetical protein
MPEFELSSVKPIASPSSGLQFCNLGQSSLDLNKEQLIKLCMSCSLKMRPKLPALFKQG